MFQPQIAIISLSPECAVGVQEVLWDEGFRSRIIEPREAVAYLRSNPTKVVFLAGSTTSIYDADARMLEELKEITKITRADGSPLRILGLGLGASIVACWLGCTVTKIKPERGEVAISVRRLPGSEAIFKGIGDNLCAVIARGDDIKLSDDHAAKRCACSIIARASEMDWKWNSGHSRPTVIAINRGVLWGLLIRLDKTEPSNGKKMLRNFVEASGCARDWDSHAIVEYIRRTTLDQLRGRTFVLAFGGIVSTLMAEILRGHVRSDRMRAVTVYCGQFRTFEPLSIARRARKAGVPLYFVNKQDEMLGEMVDEIRPWEKRRRFRKVVASGLAEAARSFGTQVLETCSLESDIHESEDREGMVSSSRFRVRLQMPGFEQLEPLKLLKSDIWRLASEMFPESVAQCQSFPLQGLYGRITNVPVTLERLERLRSADHLARKLLRNHASHVIVTYGCDRWGFKDGEPFFGASIDIRPIEATDNFRYVRGVIPPPAIVRLVTNEISRLPGITQVGWDWTEKSAVERFPGRTEPE